MLAVQQVSNPQGIYHFVQMNQRPIKTLVRNNLTLTSVFNSQENIKLNINMNKKYTLEHKMPE